MMTQLLLKAKRFYFVIGGLIVWGLYWGYQHKTIGFSPAKIVSDFSHHKEWEIEEPPRTLLDPIFDQPYTFLAVGSQSYAFASADGNYVIKFFRMKHQIPRVTDLFHPEEVRHRKENLVSIFDAHKLAFDEMRDDAGLIYLHLNKTDHLQRQLTVRDWFGRRHTIDLDQTEFVIQEKGELIFDRLQRLLKQRDLSAVDQSVAAILDLVQRRIERGISDHDKAVKHNYGYIGDRAVQLDIGRIYREAKPRDYEKVQARIEKWLKENRQEKPFNIGDIRSNLPVNRAWETAAPTEEQKRVLALSPFKFLGEGAQAFAFESSDGKYVLKFFKMRRFTPDWKDHLCPHLAYRRIKNLRWVFNGYKAAYDHLREDTGIVYLHLTKRSDWEQRVVLLDRAGGSHFVDLNQFEFVVQEKAELIFSKLNRLLETGDREKLDAAIHSVLNLVQRRIDRGYADRDFAVSNNYGFVGDRPIQLDIGRLYPGEREHQLEHVKNRIELWLKEQNR